MHKELTTVTPFSKAVALIIFILFPVGALVIGYRYGEAVERQKSAGELYAYIQKKNNPAKPSGLVGMTQEYYGRDGSQILYTNKKAGFSMSFPGSFSAKDTACSVVLDKSKTGSPRSPYIHLGIDDGSKNTSCWSFYTGQESDYTKLFPLKVGERVQRKPFYAYERKSDVRENAITWRVYVNETVWEFAPGTKTYTYMTEDQGRRVWLMGIVTANGQEQEEDILLSELESIRDSVAFKTSPAR